MPTDRQTQTIGDGNTYMRIVTAGSRNRVSFTYAFNTPIDYGRRMVSKLAMNALNLVQKASCCVVLSLSCDAIDFECVFRVDESIPLNSMDGWFALLFAESCHLCTVMFAMIVMD